MELVTLTSERLIYRTESLLCVSNSFRLILLFNNLVIFLYYIVCSKILYLAIRIVLVAVEEVMEEFRHNGRDFEYCPDLDTDMGKQITPRRKKNKKPLPTECVFCRNNGEEATYYREHLLKDVYGRVSCPVLRYTFCNVKGVFNLIYLKSVEYVHILISIYISGI